MKKINKRNIIAAYARWLYLKKAWRTNKKIVIIESDDWGSIRTSGKEAYRNLQNLGYDMSKSPYTLDALESNEDMVALYETLHAVRDVQDNPASVTANMILANPDFEAIQNNNFSTYKYETVDTTLGNYQGRDQVRDLWKEGLKTNMFFPQLHAREHVRYWDWMTDLKQNKAEALETFKLKMCGVPRVVSKTSTSYYHPPYIDDQILKNENVNLDNLISEGAKLFKAEFGFGSKTTIAPNCGWTESAEKIWNKNGVKFIQGGFLQEHHMKNTTNYIPHYLGEKSKINDMLYLVRNCTFEPSKSNNSDYWQSTFKEVERAFSKKTPAIISSHRVNFIGSIKEKNRENGLKQLKQLLEKIVQQYPDVIFLNSHQLGDMIANDNS
ncbi:hypothetical protein [uncultured Winogradskyella sp.]|uniref:hypothetical protein n=1 Tax=uncultured Winogradskyella sp. TaxID=395353 RepID=UPI002638BEF4|nr:hypothetical protein [uncultured Winogradskyella sp.]